MRRETQNILLVLLGGALLKISFTGIYLRYVKPAHQWLLIVAGIVMIGLAAISIARELRGWRGSPDGHGDHDHPARGAFMLLLPVLAVFLVAPPALGADTVQRAAGSPARIAPSTGAVTDESLYPPLPAADVLPLQLSEFAERAAWASDSLDDRAIRLTGFVVHQGKSVYLARIAITCCAADAYPVKVKLLGGGLSRLANDSWIEAVVDLKPGSSTKATAYVPSATVRSVTTVAEPTDPYEH